ncbi:methylthioribose-1-phosphate isomerase [Desulfosarcina ovata subsp. sediminis]|uniref:Methylthioribose-1-phosphate isomerase n=1 Tax=Desulfosarcina ovata subsp. sediminis TaxID=885957 RepID=A0A5K8A1C5_9BACT|nr:S-methyl-5-thioribose-1-phosphate isomerase [Desulfosarcina ovata]BBO86342.1 methylthioribose-1-phosphate isomerase [Desulfosarcina ovata subsp. sediminis]
MNVDGKQLRPIWLGEDGVTVKVIDQRQLPHCFVVADLITVDQVIEAIQEMFVRGAPLIGVTGAYGVMLAAIAAQTTADPLKTIQAECDRIRAARPTAVNLAWGVDRVFQRVLAAGSDAERIEAARSEAAAIAELEAENCRLIGEHGARLIQAISHGKRGDTVNILTHCNAGWLACIEYGTATAPIYEAHHRGIDVHVWVDETRPLNQGARLTAWEMGKHGVPHTVITDNAGGHLMQHGRVDMVIVGTDRSTHTGDVANKIGTYLKALAARDNGIPFYVALPSSTFDWAMTDGVKEIPIEERNPDEVRYIQGLAGGKLVKVLVPPEASPAADFAFDVTPARLVTGFITERGICGASRTEIHQLFPEHD